MRTGGDDSLFHGDSVDARLLTTHFHEPPFTLHEHENAHAHDVVVLVLVLVDREPWLVVGGW